MRFVPLVGTAGWMEMEPTGDSRGVCSTAGPNEVTEMIAEAAEQFSDVDTADLIGFIDWLRQHNQQQEQAVGFYGLDLYSMYTSISEVLAYLDRVDPETARTARHRYGCLSPWEGDPATYGLATLSGNHEKCEADVLRMLQELLDRRVEYVQHDGRQYFDASQNARLIANAEKYYRQMYYGGSTSWNLRDTHLS